MRFSQGLQCTALPVSYDRKMEKIVDCEGVFGALLTLKPLIVFHMTLSLQN